MNREVQIAYLPDDSRERGLPVKSARIVFARRLLEHPDYTRRILSTTQAATILRREPCTLAEAARLGRLAHARIPVRVRGNHNGGGMMERYYFSMQDLADYIDAGKWRSYRESEHGRWTQAELLDLWRGVEIPDRSRQAMKLIRLRYKCMRWFFVTQHAAGQALKRIYAQRTNCPGIDIAQIHVLRWMQTANWIGRMGLADIYRHQRFIAIVTKPQVERGWPVVATVITPSWLVRHHRAKKLDKTAQPWPVPIGFQRRKP